MKRNTRVTSSSIWWILLVFSAVLTVPPTCLADNRKAAKAKMAEGGRMIEQDNYLAALQAFREAYELYPNQTTLFNIGMCYKALYRYVEAIETFKRCVRSPQAKADIKRKAADTILELERLIGKLRIEGAPHGASVIVNGKKAAQTPLSEPLMLDPGQHALWVSKQGYRTLKTEITIGSGAVLSVRAALARRGSMLRVDCRGEDAVVRVDGGVAGGCPFEGEVEPGSHQVTVMAPGQNPFKREIEIEPGGNMVVTVPKQQQPEPVVDDNGISPLLISGIATTVVGLGVLGGVGGTFTAKYYSDMEEIEKVASRPEPDEAQNSELREAKYNELKEAISGDETGMIVGYAVGGALVVGGAVLLLLHFTGGEQQPQSTARTSASVVPWFALTTGGIAIRY